MILTSALLTILAVYSSEAIDWESFKEKHVDISATIPRIIGGNEAAPHQFPYQVGLLLNGNAFCGGSLVSTNYVLTAAHCAMVIGRVEVILGAHNVTADETTQVRLTGKEVVIHEKFTTRDYQYDIALIRLSEPAILNDYIQTIPLPSRSALNETYEKEVVTSTGWGLTGDLDYTPTINDISPVLRYVEVQVQSLEECGDFYNTNSHNITYVTDLNICTSGYKNKGTCNGDSGGPLVYEGIQIGLVSIGTTLCELCSPSIFTNIVKYLDWIEANSDVVV